MATAREQEDKQAQVAKLSAGRANPTEIAEIMGIHRSTVYKYLAKIRQRGLDRLMLTPADEARSVADEIAQMDAMYQRALRDMEEHTESGSRERIASIKALIDLKRLKITTCAELGVFKKAPQRHLHMDGGELSKLSGTELQEYLAELEQKEAQLMRVGSRGGAADGD